MRRFAERSEDVAVVARRAEAAADCLARWQAGLRGDDETSDEWIRWVDVGPQGWQLHASPLSVADVFRRQVDQTGRAWIFTSATLAVGRDFSHYTSQLGLADAATGCWDSPFDYATQGTALRAARPARAEQRRAHERGRRRCAAGAEGERRARVPAVHDACARSMRRANGWPTAFEREGLDFPVLVQGDGSKTELLLRFRALGNAVLLGSASFWEGVDVPGDALSVVVIDKLPFAPPDDPLLAARLDQARGRGRQRIHGLAVAAGGDQPQAGRRPADPHRDRPRRADALRSAADRQALRPADLAEPAADEAHARACRRHRFFRERLDVS